MDGEAPEVSERLLLERKLNPRQVAFVRLVAEGETLTRAYLAVYPDEPGMMDESVARSAGARLFAQVSVRKYYELLTGEAWEKAVIDVAAVLAELERVALNEDRDKAMGAKVRAAEVLLDRGQGAVTKKREVSGPGGKPIAVKHDHGMSPKQLDDIKRNLLGIPDDGT